MTKQVRDWNKDMELLQKPHKNVADVATILEGVAPYWLGKATEWKAEAYKSEVKYHESLDRTIALEIKLEAEKERADKLQTELSEYTEAYWKAFEQEKKLREAIEQEIKMGIIWGDYDRASALEELLASLYPKEEETQ